MRQKISRHWISSRKPGKQNKYRYNAPLHTKQKFVHVHLSKDLRQKFSTRSLMPKKGDKVKIMRGEHKGKLVKIQKIDLKRTKLFLEDISLAKKDGNKVMIPIEPSNVMLIDYSLDDKQRKKIIERKKKSDKPQRAEKKQNNQKPMKQ